MNNPLLAFGWPNMFLLELHREYFLFFRNELVGIYSDEEMSKGEYLNMYLDAFEKSEKSEED